MEFVNAVRGIIEKFRDAGKSEKEISSIIEEATEKATVNRDAIKDRSSQDRKKRRNTNNWRKMHGMPMRRKWKAGKRNARRKRADCY